MAAEEQEADSQWQCILLCAATLQTQVFSKVFAQVGLCQVTTALTSLESSRLQTD